MAYLYKAAETVRVRTVLELRLHQPTCIACAITTATGRVSRVHSNHVVLVLADRGDRTVQTHAKGTTARQ